MKGTETKLVKKTAKATKANKKGKANLHDLPCAIAAPNPAAAVGNLDIRTETVGNVSTMKSRKRNPHTTTTLDMRPPEPGGGTTSREVVSSGAFPLCDAWVVRAVSVVLTSLSVSVFR
jgi:hypothetical protein